MSGGSKHAIPFKSQKDLNDFIVIDLETTGLDPRECAIIQLSAVRYINHIETEHFSMYVNPRCHIPERVSQLTGITDNDVLDAPYLEDIIVDYIRFLSKSKYITGYNVNFDFSFLSTFVGRDIRQHYDWFDTMTLFRRVIKLDRYRLSDACDVIGYSTDFHDALCDCRACGAVLNYLCENNRMDHALHSKAERYAALADYHKKVSASECNLDMNSICPNGLFKGKNIVFTGALSFSRSDACKMALLAGACVKTSVSKKTNYLVVGVQDEVLVGCDGMSDKEEKAHALIADGYDIRILNECNFIEMLQQEVTCVKNADEQIQLNLLCNEDQPEISVLEQQVYDIEILPSIKSLCEDQNLPLEEFQIKSGINYSSVLFGSYLLMRLKFRGKKHYMAVSKSVAKELPDGIETISIKSDESYVRIPISVDEMYTLSPAIRMIIVSAMKHIPTEYDCCAYYQQCSDEKKCVREDRKSALLCGYKKKLDAGIIFYGKNRNV